MILKTHMQIQMTSNSQSNSEQKVQKLVASQFQTQTTLQNYNNKNRMVLAQKQT
jgi:hypothetical protein